MKVELKNTVIRKDTRKYIVDLATEGDVFTIPTTMWEFYCACALSAWEYSGGGMETRHTEIRL